MKRIKILRIITRLNVGGPSRQAIDLSCDVDQWNTLLMSGQLKNQEKDMGYYIKDREINHVFSRHLINPIHPYHDIRAILDVINIIKAFKPNIIHTHHAKAGLVGRIAGMICRIPVIHTFHGHVFRGHFSKPKSKLIQMIERILSPLSQALIAISDEQKKDLCDIFNIAPPSKVHVIPLGFHLEAFTQSQISQREAREKFNLPHDQKIIGIIGRLTHVKNHVFFLKSLVHLNNDWRALIVGDGELKQKLQSLAQHLNIEHKIIWQQTVEDIIPLYKSLDVLAITSHSEGTPVTMIEAMATAVPVIASRVGGITDLAQNEQNCLTYAPGDINDFINKVQSIQDQPSKSAQRVIAAQQYVLKHHNFKNLVQKIDDLYHKILL